MKSLLALALFIIQAAAPQQVRTGSIDGVVTKAGTGDPLSGVRVVLGRPGAPIAVMTGADGKFVFSNLGPGSYLLSASLPGYVMTEHGAQIVLTPGEQRRGIRLAMPQTGVVAGRVLDKNGEPVKRALVQAQRQAYTDGFATIVTVQAVATNDLGEYRLFWLPPGQYYVSATLTDPSSPTLPVLIAPNPTYIATDVARAVVLFSATSATSTVNPVTSRPVIGGTIEEAAVLLYYPGTANLETASRIEVRPGSTTGGIDFTAASVRVFSVRGTLVDETTGSPIRASNVSIFRKSSVDTTPLRVTSNLTASGFEFTGIAPGSYIIQARSVPANQDPLPTVMAGQVAVDVADADLNNVPIVVRRPIFMNGRITLEGQSSLLNSSPRPAGQTVARIVLRSEDRYEISATAGPDGGFIATVPFRGAFHVFVRNLSGFSGYVKSIRLGSEDGLYDRIHLDGPTQNTLDIVVSLNPGKLAGTVVNERREPAQNLKVVLVPDSRFRNRPDLFLVASTDSAGKFSMEGIAPGNYKAFAWEDVESGAWFDPEFMRVQETRGMPVSFVEGSLENVELRAIPAGR